ncbi:hypothetical protein LX15_003129 [Streptoalloteichus tenebrarius]|uniref:Uncharacterized protein n=1 Tax=Streptoalloteichus tenebrarius (strain ATCC 17920 / DSM 40477 / JCM 4838 / CBS 697.72 / NBRC 16177 / NCIMB 11028 / NRRL B-12390 / A12253. 1 / ISP 5477) TaxID=1933 RepID=A0ABT1HV69_STRSD|nr:hypothetical protein [Streptoalloteichus tenebrarius]MCP2259428.1 hypothetical protein [Streptoalloteichus tenebrarius]
MSGTGTARGWGERLRVAVLRLAAVGGLTVGLTAATWLASTATASATEAPVRDGSSSPAVVAEQNGRPAEAPARAGVHGHQGLLGRNLPNPCDRRGDVAPSGGAGRPTNTSQDGPGVLGVLGVVRAVVGGVGAIDGISGAGGPSDIGSGLSGGISGVTNGLVNVGRVRSGTTPAAPAGSGFGPWADPLGRATEVRLEHLERLEGRLADLPLPAPLTGLAEASDTAGGPAVSAVSAVSAMSAMSVDDGMEHGFVLGEDLDEGHARGEQAGPPAHRPHQPSHPGSAATGRRPGPALVGPPAPRPGHGPAPAEDAPAEDTTTDPTDPAPEPVGSPASPTASTDVDGGAGALRVPRIPSLSALPEPTAADTGVENADGTVPDGDNRTPLLPDPPPLPLPSPSSLATGGAQEAGGARGVAGVLFHQPSVPEPAGTRAERSAGSAAVGGLPRRPATSPD